MASAASAASAASVSASPDSASSAAAAPSGSDAALPGGAAPEPRRFPCLVCGKTFTRKYNLDAHVRSHNNIKPFACDECPDAFVRKHDLQRHIVSVHKRSTFGPCPHCGRTYSRSDSYRKHLRTEHDLPASVIAATATATSAMVVSGGYLQDFSDARPLSLQPPAQPMYQFLAQRPALTAYGRPYDRVYDQVYDPEQTGPTLSEVDPHDEPVHDPAARDHAMYDHVAHDRAAHDSTTLDPAREKYAAPDAGEAELHDVEMRGHDMYDHDMYRHSPHAHKADEAHPRGPREYDRGPLGAHPAALDPHHQHYDLNRQYGHRNFVARALDPALRDRPQFDPPAYMHYPREHHERQGFAGAPQPFAPAAAGAASSYPSQPQDPASAQARVGRPNPFPHTGKQ
ncbi:hypothetical protein HK105_200975 [Polyrhizophydium stewartii]|uniref:C2H2-type domain-containing protein n=1 Tax=Polyrhizophydium stewartii TaxID=2732419 RepID=A0ABR4NIJ2_9FUNG